MPFFKWSKSAASNGSADPTINWAEGMPPGAVNDSGRAMMARTKEWGDDISGALGTGGTASAYTFTSNQGFDSFAHMDGACIAFVPNVTNAISVTLNVDGLGAKPIQAPSGTGLGASVLIAGTPYAVTYSNSAGAFLLHGFFGNPFNTPVAGSMIFFGTTPPNSNFAFPFGQAVSRSTYATLFSTIGTVYGGGDGSTTFNLPDMRGRIPVALDNMGGVTANRLGDSGSSLASVRHTLGGAGGEDSHVMTTAELVSHVHGVNDPGHTNPIRGPSPGAFQPGATTSIVLDGTVTGKFSGGGTTDYGATGTATTGISIQSAGSSNAFNVCQPSMMVNLIMRII